MTADLQDVDPGLIVSVPCDDRSGEHVYEVRLLTELGHNYRLTPRRIADLWRQARKHEVLFSDYTEGKLEPFLLLLGDSRSIWMDVCRRGDSVPVGALYITDVRPYHDAVAHFGIWDSVGSGREPVMLFVAEWLMDRYQLHRISARVPVYQRGVIRFADRFGFKQEGVTREGVLYKGRWWDVLQFGLLREELDERIRRIW